tara:strand:- start:225 stop:722 length:498 start_codon:yes stop_codon:yes gene_type:complete
MKTIFAFTLCLFAFGAFAQEEAIVKRNENSDVFNFAVVETVPVIEGCDSVNQGDQAELRNCFTTNLSRHVSKYFQYSESARRLSVEGIIYLTFIVSEKGEIENVEVVRGIQRNYASGTKAEKRAAKELEDEAIRVIRLIEIKKPASQRGEPVRMSFTMPINAKLG